MADEIILPALIKREEARARGLTRYFTGVSCKRRHIAERLVSTGGCVLCKRGREQRERVELQLGLPRFNHGEIAPRPDGPLSRKDAIAAGLTRYWTGKACPRGHIWFRRVSDRKCLKCAELASYRWTKSTPERRRHYNRKTYLYTKSNPTQWAKRNRDMRARTSYKEAFRRWLKTPYGKIQHRLRARLFKAIVGGYKRGSAVRDLGCSIAEFKTYLEEHFRPGMCWESWGTVWQLDHKRPLADFDLADRAQFLEACHYTNYEPLYVDEHYEKTGRENKARWIRQNNNPRCLNPSSIVQ